MSQTTPSPPAERPPEPPVPAPPEPPPRRPILLVTALVVAVAVIAVLVGVLLWPDDGDDGDTATEDIATTDPDAPTGGDVEDSLGDLEDSLDDLDLGDGSGSGDSEDPFGGVDADTFEDMLDNPVVRDAFVDGVVGSMGDEVTREQAECFANGVLDTMSADQILAIGASGGDISSMSSDDFSAIFDVMSDCGIDPTALD